MFPDEVVMRTRDLADPTVNPIYRRGFRRLLEELLLQLAQVLSGVEEPTEAEALHLDHDPPLGAREKVFNSAGEHVGYEPDANDPEHLIYRTATAHRFKTNVRGDGAQHPDRVLIKRQRKLEKREAAKAAAKRPGKASPSVPKFRPSSRPLQSANRWPPRGSRPFRPRKPSRS
jgi:hypothetical protein